MLRLLMALAALVMAGCTLIVVIANPRITAEDPLYRAAAIADIATFGYVTASANLPSLTMPRTARTPTTKSLLAALSLPGFNTFTPTAAFLGNQSTLVGGALKPSSNLAGTLLVRETDCSLTQYSFADTAVGATPGLTVLPGFDAYAHRTAGLTTTAGAFPRGCADRRLGSVSSPGTFLGRASNGDLLAVSVNSTPQITLLRVNTSGEVVSTTALGTNNKGFDVAAADVNGDGIADVVTPYITANGQSGVGVFLSRADGSFGAVTVYTGYPAGATGGVFHVSIEDINGDGKPDIVASYAALAIADVNKDGRADLVFATQDQSLNDTVFIAPGKGDGSFATATSLVLPGGGPLIRSIAVADFTFDGNLDVMLAADGYSAVLPGRGDGTLIGVVALVIAGGGKYVAAADLNKDTVADAVMAGSLGIVPLLRTRSALDVVIEFYNMPLDNYFITANPAEAAAIESGSAGPGWARTGERFNFNSGGATYVCRFYGSLSPGPNSHFYTVSSSECDGLKVLQATTPPTQPRWNFESLDFVSTRSANGVCPAGTVPVYRAYNNGLNRRVDSNHRITTNPAGIAAVVARGWVSEGVVMCAPV